MIVREKGVLEIAEHEGVVLGPYFDSKNILTYGVGHTAAAGDPRPEDMPRVDTRRWSQSQVKAEMVKALRLFDEDLDKYEARVNDAVKVPLKQHQFDALVSFDFNTGGIYRAKLTEALNKGDYKKAAQGFMGWLKPKEIIKRREAEMRLFISGQYDANGSMISVWDTDKNGRLYHRGSINSKELESLMKEAKTKRKPLVLSFSGLVSFFLRVFS